MSSKIQIVQYLANISNGRSVPSILCTASYKELHNDCWGILWHRKVFRRCLPGRQIQSTDLQSIINSETWQCQRWSKHHGAAWPSSWQERFMRAFDWSMSSSQKFQCFEQNDSICGFLAGGVAADVWGKSESTKRVSVFSPQFWFT